MIKMLMTDLLGRIGLTVRRKQYKWEHLNTVRVEHLTLDSLIHRIMLKDGALSVVQVGAFDGVSNNAVDYNKLARYCRLKAVLVEPNPVAFQKLVDNLGENTSIQFVNAAVDITDGTRAFTVVKPHDLEMYHWIEQLSSFDKQTILSHRDKVPELETYMQEVVVGCVTLSSLLRNQSIGRLDLLLVDTEGYDALLVSNALDENLRPSVVLFEHTHLDTVTILGIQRNLVSKGYSVIDVGQDFLCWDQSVLVG